MGARCAPQGGPTGAHGVAERAVCGKVPDELDEYRVIRSLGVGGMGEVYLATLGN